MPFGDNGGNSRKKKIAIIGTSALILVAMVVAVAVGFNRGEDGGASPPGASSAQAPAVATTTKAIQSICQPTDYRETCENSLTKTAGNTSDPKELIKAAFTVAVEQISAAIKNSSTLKELAKDPRTNQALANCDELLDYATDDIKDSFAKIGPFEPSKIDEYLADLKVWLSGAVTYEQTCLDGFENTTGDAGEKMKAILRTSQELTSNGLAIVTELSSLLTSYDVLPFSLNSTSPPATNARRLLGSSDSVVKEVVDVDECDDDGDVAIPKWVGSGARRLLQLAPNAIKADIVVAQDGSGRFKTVNEALKAIPKKSAKRFVIHIKAGVYKEQVFVDKTLTNVMFLGDGPTRTKITGSLNFVDGIQTFKTATVSIIGSGFIARDIGFENSAGAIKHQAVALRVQSDMSIFYNCQMDGHQDTLYTHTHRQFYRDCVVSGTIDFIFGDAAAVFQNCKFIVRKPLENQFCIVTAQGRSDRRQASGLVLQNCTVSGDPLYIPNKLKNKAYLGRPWKEFSRTIYLQSKIDDIIAPEGWLPWAGTFAIDTCFYAEIANRGPGADVARRVKWKGIKKIDIGAAAEFTPARFIGTDTWVKAAGVPYIPGMVAV